MLQKIYAFLIKPRSADLSIQNRELVLNYLLLGMISLSVLELLIAGFGFAFLGFHYLLVRLLTMVLVALFLGGLYYLARFRQRYFAVAGVFAIFFFLVACLVVYVWGPVTPIGILLFSLAIVIAGILLGARYSLLCAGLTVLVLGLLQYAQTYWGLQPDLTWMDNPSSQRDVISFGVIFFLIAVVSWLFNQQMEQSLRRAQKSEAALSRQKALLEIKVEERTRELEAAQVEKIKQVYRFAELGRVSSALFHDLANHLASVSLDIEGLEPAGRSKIMRRIQQDIHYIDDVVQRVRFQLRGQSEIERFNVVKEINYLTKIMSYQTVQARVIVTVQQSGVSPIFYKGDITRFRQIVSNLLANAVEAYPTASSRIKKPREVELHVKKTASELILRIKDYGHGIKKSDLNKVFEPFYTNKHDGTGIGLFIVKQIVEEDLHGSIQLTSSTRSGTEFTVTLPLAS